MGISTSFAANEMAQTFNYQGQFFNELGTAPLLDTVDLTLEIFDPTGTCLLYSEQQNNINLNTTNGLFSVQIGSLTVGPTAAKRTQNPAPATELDPGLPMELIFTNLGPVTGAIANCGAGYTASAGDGRLLRVIVDDLTTSTTVTLSPDLPIGAAPQAMNAQTLQGFIPSNFINVDTHMTQAAADLLTSGGDASSLHNHDSLYVKLATAATQNLGTGITYTTGDLGIGTAAPGGALEVDPTAAEIGEIIKAKPTQSTDLLDIYGSGGTLAVSVNSAGVLSVGGSPVATTSTLGSYLPLAGGALTGAVTNSSSYTTTGGVLFKNGANSVGFLPPASAPAGNVTWTLPAADGTPNQFLQTTGTGALQWASGSAGGITSLDGLSGSSQTFATTEAATSVAPVFTAATTVHTLNIPMASVAATTAGLLSNTDYASFTAKAGGSANLVDVNTLTKVSAAGAVGEAKGISALATANVTNLIVEAGSAQGATDYQDWEDNSGTIQYSLNSSGTPSATTDLVTKAFVTTAISAAGGITSLDGLTGASQTFATTEAASSTAPAFTAATTVHTLNIPMASVAATTAGLLSNTDYASFTAKVAGSANIPAGASGTMIVANGTAGTVSESTGVTSAISTTNTDLVVKAGTGQSTDLQDWENNSGTVLYSTNKTGTPSAATDLVTVSYVSSAITANNSNALLVANNLSDLASASTARTNLGLGTAATQASAAFDVSGAAATAQAASLQKSSNLSDVANATTALTNILPSQTTASGQVLESNGTTASWQSIPAGYVNPMTTLGDVIYENSTPAVARLAGNTSATKEFLSQTGTGAVSAAPAWSALASGDIPNNAANTSGTAANLSGTPALPNGTTGTTQTTGDTTTKLATDAFVVNTIGTVVADATFTVGTTAIAANTCTSASTVTMTGLTTTMAFSMSPNADVSGVTGWGSTGGLVIDAWPTVNTLNYKVCNQTASSITPSGSVTFNVSAR